MTIADITTHSFAVTASTVQPADRAGEAIPAVVGSGVWRQNGLLVCDTDRNLNPVVLFDVGTSQVEASLDVSPDGGDCLAVRNGLWRLRNEKTITTTTNPSVKQWEWGNYLPVSSGGVSSHTLYVTGWGSESFPPGNVVSSYSHVHGTYASHTHSDGSPFKTGQTRFVGGGTSTSTQYYTRLEVFDASVWQLVGTVATSPASNHKILDVGNTLTAYAAGKTFTTVDARHKVTSTKVGARRGPSQQSGSAMDNLRVVPQLTAPNAPLLLAPVNGGYVDANALLLMRIAHSDDDPGDTKTAGVWYVRDNALTDDDWLAWNGAAWVAVTQAERFATAATFQAITTPKFVTGNTDQVDATGTLANGKTWLWSARTRDTADLWGAAAASKQFTTQTKPVLSIVSPGPDNPAVRIAPTHFLDYFQADGEPMTAHRVRVIQGTGVAAADAETAPAVADTGKVTGASVAVDIAGLALAPGVEYTAVAWAWTTGDQRSDAALTTYLVDLPVPAVPVHTISDEPFDGRVRDGVIVVGNAYDSETGDLDGETVPADLVITGASASMSTEQQRTGGRSMKLVASGSGDIVVRWPAQRFDAGQPISSVTSVRDGGIVAPVYERLFVRDDQANTLAAPVSDPVTSGSVVTPPPTVETFGLTVWATPQRTGPVPADGEAVSTRPYISVTTAAFGTDLANVTQVAWSVDGAAANVDTIKPFDLGGGSAGSAAGYALTPGSHTISAVVTRNGVAEPPRTATVYAVAQPSLDLLVSTRSDRADGIPLEGETVSGLVAITVEYSESVETLPDGLSVTFYVDDVEVGVDTARPYDLKGGTVTLAAMYDTTGLTNGSHDARAVIVHPDGAVWKAAARFDVANATVSTAGLVRGPTRDAYTAGTTTPLGSTITDQPWIFLDLADGVAVSAELVMRTSGGAESVIWSENSWVWGNTTTAPALPSGTYELYARYTLPSGEIRTSTRYTVTVSTPAPPSGLDSYVLDFASVPLGGVSAADVEEMWSPLSLSYFKTSSSGAEIVSVTGGPKSKALRLNYTADADGTGGFSGYASEIKLPNSTFGVLEFSMFFPSSYSSTFKSATAGGKLPGFGAIGTTSAYSSGDLKPPMHCVDNMRRTDGWSARHMWHNGAGLHQYLYYADKTNRCGDNNHFNNVDQLPEPYSTRDRDTLTTGVWYRMRQEIDVDSGIVRSYLNGTLRATSQINFYGQPINRLIMSPYINKPGPTNATYALFADFYMELS